MAKRTTISLYEAKTHLSELGERAANGEEIVVTKHGKPRFRIAAIPAARPRPAPGAVALDIPRAGREALGDFDWFAPDEELERAFGMRE